MAWTVELTSEFAAWARELRKLDRESARQVGAAVELLKEHGPALKRPLVAEIAASTIKNMKELRPGSAGRSEIRVLFVLRSVAADRAAGGRGQGGRLARVVPQGDTASRATVCGAS